MTREQRIRVNNFVPGFYKYLREGTIAHCRKLYKDGMVTEAVEILRDFTGDSELVCLKTIRSLDLEESNNERDNPSLVGKD